MSEELNNLENQNNETNSIDNTPEVASPTEKNVEATPDSIDTNSQGYINNDGAENSEVKKESDEKIEKDDLEQSNELNDKKNDKKAKFNAVFNELKVVKEADGQIEVEVVSRVKGGLRVLYKDVELFMPASHFLENIRSPREEDLQEAIGCKFMVNIKQLQVSEGGQKAIIVSRKKILKSNSQNLIKDMKIGQVVSGKVTSVTNFGLFVDIGGIEGLIHISRLSNEQIEDINAIYKKGDTIESKIIEIDKHRNKIGLSKKALEPSPWDNFSNEIEEGNIYQGIIKRMTDFGVIVKLKTGIEGLIRLPELSWTKRIKHPSDLFAVGEEINVYVMSINIDKRSILLSYKRTMSNPWNVFPEKYPIGTELTGAINQVVPQGAVLTFEEFDAFMPMGKVRGSLREKLKIGETMMVKIIDLVPDNESIIIEPVYPKREKKEFNPNYQRNDRNDNSQFEKLPKATPISFLDLLSDSDKEVFLKKD